MRNIGPLFVLNQKKAAQAFLRQVSLIKNMDKIVKQQISLVEAANATPYGWNVAKHLEPEHRIFSEQDKVNESSEGSQSFSEKGQQGVQS